MDLIIRLTLLSALIFGLCGAQWIIEDYWMNNAPPLSEHEIETKVHKSLLAHGNDYRKSMGLFQTLMEQYREENIYSKEHYDNILKKISEFQEELKTEKDILQKMDSQLKFQNDLLNDLKKFPLPPHSTMLSSFAEFSVRRLEKIHPEYMEDLESRRQATLSDSRRGIRAKTQVEVHRSNVSINLNVPLGKTLVIFRHEKQTPEGSNPMWISVSDNTRSLFKFDLREEGNPAAVNYFGTLYLPVMNGTRKEGRISEETTAQCYDDDEALTRPRYQVIMNDHSTKKWVVYYNSDGTKSGIHQTIDRLENDVFEQKNYLWKYDSNGIPSVEDSSEYLIDLNHSRKAVVLKGLCSGSLIIKKKLGNEEIIEKKLICTNK